MSNDTSTQLNAGSGGDRLDESLVLQSDGVTQVKRTRIVIGGDAGFDGTTNDLVQPTAAPTEPNPVSIPTLPQAVVNDSPESGYVVGEMRALSMTTDGRLRVSTAAARIEMAMFEPEEKSMWSDLVAHATQQQSSPWNTW